MAPSALPSSLLTDALHACVVGVVVTDALEGITRSCTPTRRSNG
ncbi:hypothetical protein ACFSC4_19975 [Deinococcus malanensis]